MNKSLVASLIRLLSIYCFVQDYSNSSHIFLSNRYDLSWEVYLYTVLFILSIPLILWFSAPFLARFIDNSVELSKTEATKISTENILSAGIFILGIYLLPTAGSSLISFIDLILASNFDLSTSDIWNSSSAVRAQFISSFSLLVFSLLFIFKHKKFVSLFNNH